MAQDSLKLFGISVRSEIKVLGSRTKLWEIREKRSEKHNFDSFGSIIAGSNYRYETIRLIFRDEDDVFRASIDWQHHVEGFSILTSDPRYFAGEEGWKADPFPRWKRTQRKIVTLADREEFANALLGALRFFALDMSVLALIIRHPLIRQQLIVEKELQNERWCGTYASVLPFSP